MLAYFSMYAKIYVHILRIWANRINKALKIVQTWCNETGLHINPEKTELVRFTKKTKKDLKMHKIKLFDEELKLKKSVKYLGIYLDQKLSILEHINQMYKKGIKSLWATKSIVSRNERFVFEILNK